MNETEALTESLKPLPDETGRAHAAFMAYVGMGLQRSVDKAYRICYRVPSGGNEGAGRGRAPTFFQEWASRFRWKDRVEAYEALLESEYCRAMKDRHYQELVEYQKERLTQGRQLAEISQAMAVYGAKQLRRLVEENVPMDSDAAARFLRAMAFVSVAATEAKADALSIKHLTTELEEQRRAEVLDDE